MMAVAAKCEYCKHNEGENKKFGFMWHCKLLGHCVPFGWHKCKANEKGKGSFEIDEVKYREYKTEKK